MPHATFEITSMTDIFPKFQLHYRLEMLEGKTARYSYVEK